MDWVALAALGSTEELFPLTLGLVAALFVLGLILRRPLPWKTTGFKPGPGFFAVIIGATILLAALLWRHFHLPLIIAVANSVPLLHGSLWLLSDRSGIARTAQLRLAVGFSELLVAAILTSGVSLILGIFVFSILASVAVSTSHIALVFQENGRTDPSLTPRYLASSLALAFVVLLSSLLIFPLLPRTRVGIGIEAAAKQTGYTEQVRLDRLSETLGSGRGRVLLRISGSPQQFKDSQDLATSLPFGLIRTRALGRFDGTQWYPLPPPRNRSRRSADLSGRILWLDLEREPLNSDALPVPYGTVHVIPGMERMAVEVHPNGEFGAPTQARQALRYRIAMRSGSPLGSYGSPSSDLPREEHLAVPRTLANGRMRALARNIFGGRRNEAPEVRVERLRNFFASNRFGPSLSGPTTPELGLTPIEHFLIAEKSGNCELFASSSAILLRLAGVPTRLVAGFRLSRSAEGSVLAVRSGDAHAWLEYFVSGRGWRPFDPTPRLVEPGGAWSGLLRAYDWAEGFWYQHFYSFDAAAQAELGTRTWSQFRQSAAIGTSPEEWGRAIRDLLHGAQGLMVTLLLLLAVLGLGYGAVQFFRGSRPRGRGGSAAPWRLRLHLSRAARLLRSEFGRKEELDPLRAAEMILVRRGPEAASSYRSWRSAYLSARFDPDGAASAGELTRRLSALSHSLRSG